MIIETSKVVKHVFSKVPRLDPVHVFLEDICKGQGRITISCYGKSWSSYWGGMGDRNMSEFFCDCNEGYLAGNLAPRLDSEINDIDKIEEEARNKGVECWRDDPWNDFDFMSKMYGDDMGEWHYLLPKIENPDYEYLCRIIKAVQSGLKVISDGLRTLEKAEEAS